MWFAAASASASQRFTVSIRARLSRVQSAIDKPTIKHGDLAVDSHVWPSSHKALTVVGQKRPTKKVIVRLHAVEMQGWYSD